MPRILLSLSILLLAGCGYTRTGPDPLPTPSPGAPPQPTIVSIGSSGVSPQVLHVFETKRATFVNDDNRPHAIFSDRHPTHEECDGILNLGTLAPGERREVANLPYGACYFHDDTNPTTFSYQGVLVIH